jgi:oxygen-independent coproporphyrinogen-3 oxidase
VSDRPLGLYLHWPYCHRICPYCDFNVYKARGDDAALVEAILNDMARWRERTGARRLSSLHFGGGTPSLLPAADIARFVEAADRLWGFEDAAEIGLEANPEDQPRFADFAAAGIERLSLGVQALEDEALTMLGRNHDARSGVASVEAALQTFPRVSLDLIYGRAGQAPEAWRRELEQALALGTGHVSPYQLTIEDGTAFQRRVARGEALVEPPDEVAELYETTQAVCAAAGFEGYEISNHARSPADESRHNRDYWEGGDWIGVGPGAHGRLGAHREGGRVATEASRRPDAYKSAPESENEVLSDRDEAFERILMGVRLAHGLGRALLRETSGLDVDADALAALTSDGLVELDGERVRLTARGRLFADHVGMRLAGG